MYGISDPTISAPYHFGPISTIWKKIANEKRNIELSLIKQAITTHYTPLGGFAKISEVHYLKKFNSKTMVGYYRMKFKVSIYP
ncbi:hypothetical protein DAPPUDRAFT_264144 [Daphnia pulex]|uniref:Uncharacterized protein n=1 Tax=Daphnia pulex TaxID=6669 RepID=E9HQZ0_DAPPU|nr:hypothetical protein DAPPUDRAFT_264144 [Daphnia pulex]|eukprot:EFX65843.1 hypothetical protein DAPPUDRAFT_264144 [Daphnia pulex]